MNLSTTSLIKSACVVGLSFGLFACGGDKTETSQPSAKSEVAQGQAPMNDEIVVAITQDFAPFTYLDEKGGVVGFDVDIINAIAQKKGLKIHYKSTTFDDIFTAVENKTANVGASGIYDKEERRSKYGLTKPYHTDTPVYFYRADNEKLSKANLSSVADLNSQVLDIAVVGSVDGLSSNHTIHAVKSEFVGFTGVLQGKYDVAFSDASVLSHAIKSNPDSAKIELKSVKYQGDVGYVMLVNKENTELLQKLNEGIDELIQSGEMTQIKQKYGLNH
ncbi:substrate-binding periplasmic protein [Moraxella oblonga]|uniref:substrate-binding periplasmic protein n=1 Tax=Moraxella oblonga TaxID=200413 RepID=UPI0008336CF6|nr:transporter substrate-binding domain-containing protein [Moraxella oblonga]